MSIGSIIVRLTMQTADFETDAGRAAKVAEKRAKEIDASFRKAGKAIGVVLSAALVGTVYAIGKAVDKMDDLSKAAQRVGLPTEEFSRLAYAGSLADVEVDTLVSTLGKLTKSQAAAMNTTSQQAKVFDALGIAVTDSTGKMRSSFDVLNDFADKFNELNGSPEAMAAGFALFGRSFQDMIPLLKDGSAGLREAAAEADALGITLSTKAGKEAEQFNDDITRLHTIVNGFWQEVATGLIPQLDASALKLKEMGEGGDLARNAVTLLSAILSGGVSLLDNYNYAVNRLSISMTEFAEESSAALAMSKAFLTLDFSGGSDAFDKLIDARKRAVSDMNALESEHKFGKFEGTAAQMFPVPFSGQGKPFPYLQGAPAPFDFAADQQAKHAARAAIDQTKLHNALGNVPVPKASSGGSKSRKAEMTDEQKALKSLNEEYQRSIDSDRERLGMLGLETESARTLWEVENGRFKDLLPNQKAELIAQAGLYDAKQALIAEVEKEKQARDDAKKGYVDAVKSIREESETLGMTNEQLEIYNRLKYAGVDANSAFGQSIVAQTKELQAQRKSVSDQIELMDAFRDGATNALTDFVTGSKSAQDALKGFFDDLGAHITQAIANKWMDQLFGTQGSSNTGSSGGAIFSAIGSLLGLGGGGSSSGGSTAGGSWGGLNWATGGYTGAGGVHEIAGAVHKGEVVWSQGDIARAGGVGAVESMRAGSGKRSMQQTVNIVVQGSLTKQTAAQAAMEAGRSARRQIARA